MTTNSTDPLKDWRDERRFIVQNVFQTADAGDTCFKHGVLFNFNNSIAHTDEAGKQYFWPDEFIHESGQAIRHPYGKQEWTRELNRSTRDQCTSWITGLGYHLDVKLPNFSDEEYPFRAALTRMYSAILKNFSRFHNYKKNGPKTGPDRINPWYTIDIAGPEIHASFIRGLRIKWLYWLLPILDLETLVGSISWNWFRKESDNDITNHLCVLKLSVSIKPTWVSKLALKVLNKDLAILKLKQYWDFPEYSKEPLKDPPFIGEKVIEWLNAQK